MKIGIIGSGNIGGTVARLLVAAGHEVAIANSRGPQTLGELVGKLGAQAHAATVADAAAFGEIVLVAIPLYAATELPPEPFVGKLVIDANNYYPARDGNVGGLDEAHTTSSELLAAHLPGAEVVKAFNTMYFKTLATDGKPKVPRADRLTLFVAGDDAAAKAKVSGLIEQLGFAALDTGTLAAGGALQQPGSSLYNRPMRLAEAEPELARRR